MAESVELRVEVDGDEIIVTLPGTRFRATYRRRSPGIDRMNFSRSDLSAGVAVLKSPSFCEVASGDLLGPFFVPAMLRRTTSVLIRAINWSSDFLGCGACHGGNEWARSFSFALSPERKSQQASRWTTRRLSAYVMNRYVAHTACSFIN
jgi:hypothetical protein